MNILEDLLHQVKLFLESQKQRWALVGGLAVSVRTEPRFTRDLDIAVAVSDDQAAEDLVYRLHSLGFQTFATVEQETTKRLATARLSATSKPVRGLVLDLLFASSGIEEEICEAAETLSVFRDLSIPVASIYHLMILKVLSRDDRTRPQDVADLRQLVLAAKQTDITEALNAARLIENRGFNRERNLVEAMKSAWCEFRE